MTAPTPQEEPKLCKNCRWVKLKRCGFLLLSISGSFSKCRHPAARAHSTDPVTGKKEGRDWSYCDSMRGFFGECGTSAKLFEPKP